jgi:hypothetical protein
MFIDILFWWLLFGCINLLHLLLFVNEFNMAFEEEVKRSNLPIDVTPKPHTYFVAILVGYVFGPIITLQSMYKMIRYRKPF